MKYRYENFGGIIASEEPPFLAFVDRNYMRELGLKESELWNSKDESVGILSAPTEVHFAITNKCSVKCPHCYMDAGELDNGELDTQNMKKALNVLAEMGVFHVAMGGGEALERDDLFEVAAYAKEIGLVPNLTISGYGLNKEITQKLKIFGQVNLSLDGISEKSGVFRGKNIFETVTAAFELLREAGISTGINCVLGQRNYSELENLFEYAASNELNEIEFLRFKPSGRGKELYEKEKMTHEQNVELVPKLAELSEKYKVTAKIDCSFVPMMCYHKPPTQMLESMATYGCEAGNVLLGIRSNGKVSGCSFLEDTDISVFDLPVEFKNPNSEIGKQRTWVNHTMEPCTSCTYLGICKGGCHGVSKFLTGDYNMPDPECPFVIEYKNQKRKR